jgi:hypothetical protein
MLTPEQILKIAQDLQPNIPDLKVTEYLYRGTYPPGLDFIPDK